jgi:type IV fimbrial biogenesis protein FimT
MRKTLEQAAGITLIEVITTMAIVAIIVGMAAPSFANLVYDTGRTTAVNGFFHSLYLARSEAIKRARVVSICKSKDGDTCDQRLAAPWNEGWIVFVNTDRDEPPQRDRDERVLSVHQGWDSGEISSNRRAYSFRPHEQGVVNGTIVFCDPRGSAHARAIIINHIGRPRISKRDASNRPLHCSSG